MRPVRVVQGKAVPLDRSDVDTDQIIPSDWLKRVERTGFGAGLFEEWRDDPSFVLNDPVHHGAVVLVAGANFGTGSSREHAVWALMDYGFDAVVASSFGDIFRNNCTKQGLVPVQVEPSVSRALLDAIARDPEAQVTIDVEQGTVECGDIHARFELDDFTRQCLINGWDDIGLTLRDEEAITAFESRRARWLPRASSAPAPA